MTHETGIRKQILHKWNKLKKLITQTKLNQSWNIGCNLQIFNKIYVNRINKILSQRDDNRNI